LLVILPDFDAYRCGRQKGSYSVAGQGFNFGCKVGYIIGFVLLA